MGFLKRPARAVTPGRDTRNNSRQNITNVREEGGAFGGGRGGAIWGGRGRDVTVNIDGSRLDSSVVFIGLKVSFTGKLFTHEVLQSHHISHSCKIFK